MAHINMRISVGFGKLPRPTMLGLYSVVWLKVLISMGVVEHQGTTLAPSSNYVKVVAQIFTYASLLDSIV